MRLAIGWVAALAAAFLITVPIWLPDFPPLVDLPQHAANLELARQLIFGDSDWSQVVQNQWFTPYYGFYLPAFLLSLVMSSVAAAKVVAAGSMLSIPAAVAVVLRRRSLSPWLALLMLPGLYGFSFQWGFVSFMIACSALVLGVDAIERFFEDGARRGAAAILAYSTILFFLHAYAYAVFMIIYGVRWLTCSRSIRSALLVVPAGVAALVWLVWAAQGPDQAKQPILWDLGWFRFGQLMQDLLGVRFGGAEQILGGAIIAVICLGVGGARLSKSPWRLLPLLIIVGAYFVLPNRVMGTYFTYQRFSIFLLPMLMLALERRELPVQRAFQAITGLIAGLLLALVIAIQSSKAEQFDRESAGFAAVLQAIPERQRVLYLAFDPQTLWYNAPSYLHFAQWYGAQKKGFVEFNFASFYGLPVVYSPPAGALAPPNIEWFPNQFKCTGSYVNAFDYVLVKAEIDLTAMYFDDPRCGLSLVKSGGGWWLYARKDG